jgi:hypothetical protein
VCRGALLEAACSIILDVLIVEDCHCQKPGTSCVGHVVDYRSSGSSGRYSREILFQIGGVSMSKDYLPELPPGGDDIIGIKRWGGMRVHAKGKR